MSSQNILLEDFNQAPFSKIETSNYKPAILKAIDLARGEIDSITSNTAKPTFENTIEALEFSGKKLDRITSIFFNINSAETSDEIQKIAQEVSPLLSEFSNDITLNKDLFQRVEEVYKQKDTLELNKEQETLLDQKYKSFTRNGANLSLEDQKVLRDIDKMLSTLKLQFGENVLADSNKYELVVKDESRLGGLPESFKEEARSIAKSKDMEGWIFTLEHPSYIPFMKYADDIELRKELSLAFGSRAFKGDEHDNQHNVLEITRLRYERAKLLGFESHAHFVLEERMAETPEKVTSFLNEMLEKAKPAAKREFEQLEKFAQDLDQIDNLQKWDSAYYAEKLKQELFDLDDEKLKPYFQLEKVIDGVFTIAGKLYGLSFEQTSEVDVYHKDVRTYNVTDTLGNDVALFYADFHPRPGKRDGAWMTIYKQQSIENGKNERPHISIVCNFTKPTQKQPSLLTFNEVTTLFHEFGHALHGILANTTYPSLSGANVYWDFVELPSQVLENWCYEEEALQLFAKHYKTGEAIPQQYITRIKESSSFLEGMATLRQLSFGMLDLSWHAQDPSSINDVKAHETAAFEPTRLFPEVESNCMSTAFSHIFQGGYSAGYYSYKWAEVLDADTFDYFKENGIFSKDIADKFREHILSKGGTEHPMELYKRFRGKEPKPDALLRRAGLIS